MELYLVYSANDSWLSKVIKYYTKETYNHVSLSLNPHLSETYSFGRKKMTNPLIGGFVQENFWDPFFLTSDCMIYSVTVSENEFIEISQMIDFFKQNKHLFQYNFIGLLALSLEYDFERSNAYFCSEFIATLFKDCNIMSFDKEPHFVKPLDLLQTNQFTKVFEGKLIDYLEVSKSETAITQFSIA